MLGIPPLWVLLRLTDKEIRMFASQPIPVLEKYARERKLDSVRWRQIYLSYFV
ncbi:conserved membrane domain protein [Chlamydia ibidis 10-1398/6]|nr:conserved membrane domain protein [Chlamydia ibidis 10-1398/6]